MKKILTLLLLLLLLFAFGAARAEQTATVMVYMCVSDLQEDAMYDLMEMLEADIGDSVNLVILAGGAESDYGDVFRRNRMTRLVIRNHDAELEEEIPSANMGDPKTLTSFMDWSVSSYPADRYMLILWDHGGGTGSGICWDSGHNDDYLTLYEVYSALYSYEEKNPGFRLDMIGFDACLMATYETAAHVWEFADYMIASEEVEPWLAWDYNWVGELSRRPSMTTEELGILIADTYMKACLQDDPNGYLCMSVINLSAMPELIGAVEDYSGQLCDMLERNDLSGLSRNRSRMYSFGGFDYAESGCVDMMAFLEGTQQFVSNGSGAVESAYKKTVCYSTGSRNFDYLSGLSIFFPTSYDEIEELEVSEVVSRHSDFFTGFVSMRSGGNYVFGETKPDYLDYGSVTGMDFSGWDSWDSCWYGCEDDYDDSWYDYEYGYGWDSCYGYGWNSCDGYGWYDAGYSCDDSSGYGYSISGYGSGSSGYGTGSSGYGAGGSGAGIESTGYAVDGSGSGTGTDSTASAAGGSGSGLDLFGSGNGDEGEDGTPEGAYFFGVAGLTNSAKDPLGGYSITLSPDAMAHLASAEGLLLLDAGDEESYILVELGITKNVAIEWESGQVVSLYDGTWPMLEDQVVAMYETMAFRDLHRCVIPVRLNGTEGYLLATKTPMMQEWTVIGFSTGYSENGMPERGMTGLKTGDVIIPVYTAYYLDDESEDFEEISFDGDPITVGESGTVSLMFGDLTEGDDEKLQYMFAFQLTDIFGETELTDFVDFEM